MNTLLIIVALFLLVTLFLKVIKTGLKVLSVLVIIGIIAYVL